MAVLLLRRFHVTTCHFTVQVSKAIQQWTRGKQKHFSYGEFLMFFSTHERCGAGFINQLTLKFGVRENTSSNQPHLSTVGVSVPV